MVKDCGGLGFWVSEVGGVERRSSMADLGFGVWVWGVCVSVGDECEMVFGMKSSGFGDFIFLIY